MVKDNSKKSPIKEINKVVKFSKFNFETSVQWKKKGDRYEKFTMYPITHQHTFQIELL